MSEFVVPVMLTVSYAVRVEADTAAEAHQLVENQDWGSWLDHDSEYVEHEIITSGIRKKKSE